MNGTRAVVRRSSIAAHRAATNRQFTLKSDHDDSEYTGSGAAAAAEATSVVLLVAAVHNQHTR